MSRIRDSKFYYFDYNLQNKIKKELCNSNMGEEFKKHLKDGQNVYITENNINSEIHSKENCIKWEGIANKCFCIENEKNVFILYWNLKKKNFIKFQ